MGKRVVNFEVGEIIRLYRERARLSKTDVAKAIGVTAATINNYETGRTLLPYKKILQFKKVLGEDFEYALKIIDEEDGEFEGHINVTDVGVPYRLKFPRLYKVIVHLAQLDGLTTEEAYLKYGINLNEGEI